MFIMVDKINNNVNMEVMATFFNLPPFILPRIHIVYTTDSNDNTRRKLIKRSKKSISHINEAISILKGANSPKREIAITAA